MHQLKTLWRLITAARDHDVRRNIFRLVHAYRAAPEFDCPCCGRRGRFDVAGETLHFNSECPGCGARERHRLLALAVRDGFISFAGKEVLHFAPEPAVEAMVRSAAPAGYRDADRDPLSAGKVLDIERIGLPDASVDLVLCSHVLEHVDDGRALAELRRILRPGGEAVLMVPIAEGWADTFEDPSLRSESDRHRYFGQRDHVRRYGADFRERVCAAGFGLAEYAASGRDCGRYGVTPGEVVFRAMRPESG